MLVESAFNRGAACDSDFPEVNAKSTETRV